MFWLSSLLFICEKFTNSVFGSYFYQKTIWSSEELVLFLFRRYIYG